jgi:hypothetical protein
VQEQRAQADALRDEFALTGSDRTADVAASRGQTDIFNTPGASQPKTETKSEASSGKASASQVNKIEDLGEKIGGARKDTATSTERTTRVKTSDERPTWARRFQVSQIVAGEHEGRWVMRDTRSKDWLGNPKQIGRNTYATEQEALDAVPLAAVLMKHRAVPTGTKGPDGEYAYEIWRDINELEKMQTPAFWNAMLNQWKLNKTARSPVVHMNNVMSNTMLMDMADVRARDLVSGIRSMPRT